MASSPVALILGSGPRVGDSVAKAFAAQGYRIAIASRKGGSSATMPSKTPEGHLSIRVDLSDPDSVPAVFQTVKTEFGRDASPDVVIYNAASLTPPPDKDSVLSIPADGFHSDLNINTVSAYVAAQEAVKGWEKAADSNSKKTFIYTGNALNLMVVPVAMFMNLGVGKSASAHWVGLSDAMYSGTRGYRFFYTDERYEDGKLKGNEVDGPAHGEFYTQLARHEGDVPSLATFVKGKGYVKF